MERRQPDADCRSAAQEIAICNHLNHHSHVTGGRQHINQEKAAENIQALPRLRESLKHLSLRLPESFTAFMESPALHARIRSNTDCYLDLCPEAIQSPINDGHLVRFLADSQGCLFWYLYLTADGSDHAAVASPGFYRTEAEEWQEDPPDPGKIVFSAEFFLS